MTSFCRRLLPAVFMLTLVIPLHAQSSGSTAPSGSSKQGQPGRSAQSGQSDPSTSRAEQPRGPELWWRERSPISKELGLTKEQRDRIEKLFQDTRPGLNKLDDTLRRRENTLDAMIKDDSSEAMVSQQFDKVEQARSALNKARYLMLFHMRNVLSATQRARFETLHTHWLEELRQAQLEREKQDRIRKQNQKPNQNQKPDQQLAPGQTGPGRPGV